MAQIIEAKKRGHKILFHGLHLARGHITADQITDFINAFYRWEDTTFNIHVYDTTSEAREEWSDKSIKSNLRGQHRHSKMGSHVDHSILLFHRNITKDGSGNAVIGGNIYPATTPSLAYGMVLTHELQHANQIKHHSERDRFFSKKGYWNRACERDARQAVDENINEIALLLGLEPPKARPKREKGSEDELLAVVSLLAECQDITIDDIRDELRASNILNPKNVQRVLSLLREQPTQEDS